MVVLIIILAALVLATGGWLVTRMRPGSKSIQEAAAADVAAILEDSKLVSPDAPGNHEDDL